MQFKDVMHVPPNSLKAELRKSSDTINMYNKPSNPTILMKIRKTRITLPPPVNSEMIRRWLPVRMHTELHTYKCYWQNYIVIDGYDNGVVCPSLNVNTKATDVSLGGGVHSSVLNTLFAFDFEHRISTNVNSDKFCYGTRTKLRKGNTIL